MASDAPTGGGAAAAAAAASSTTTEEQTAYNDLKRLIPSLAAELELLRTSLREHSLWLLRYGHGNNVDIHPNTSSDTVAPGQQQRQRQQQQQHPQPQPQPQPQQPPTEGVAALSLSSTSTSTSPPTSSSSSSTQQPSSLPTGPPPAFSEASEPPAYTASDVPPYTGGFSTVSASTREEVRARRDQLTEWLREGEDVLREYSARYAQLAQELGQPQEDLLGTWHEAHPDNALPGYRVIEEREELMVGGVGEVPPPYLGGRVTAAGAGAGAGASSAATVTGPGRGGGNGEEGGASLVSATKGNQEGGGGGDSSSSASSSSNSKQQEGGGQ